MDKQLREQINEWNIKIGQITDMLHQIYELGELYKLEQIIDNLEDIENQMNDAVK